MKINIITFGCRSNQCDSRWIAESLAGEGCEVVEDARDVDLLIVNTCAVTAEGERQGKQALRRARRDNPHAIVIATGCAVEAEPGSFLAMPEIDYVSNFDTKYSLSKYVKKLSLRVSPTLLRSSGEADGNCFFSGAEQSRTFGHVRVPLKIQDGCNNACTYCIVSRIRGASRSMPAETVMAHIEALGKAGAKEIVLTGIHLASWGKDLEPPRTLESLLRRITLRRAVERIRISSIDPAQLTGELLDLISEGDGLCPHLHLPLQSANDDMLKAMGRNYSARDVAVRIRLLKQAVPHAAIGLDVIVGFPGETDEHFEKGMKKLQDMQFDYLHVFPFSPRPGVPASLMDGQVETEVVKKRCSKLHKLSAKRRRAFWESAIGTIRSVALENKLDNGRWFGHTDNYIPVTLPPGDFEAGKIIAVGLHKLMEDGVAGEAVR